jgi:hypothetical protein
MAMRSFLFIGTAVSLKQDNQIKIAIACNQVGTLGKLSGADDYDLVGHADLLGQ